MTKKIIFLLEEPSMGEFLGSFLSQIGIDNRRWQCIIHQGKSDLEKSIPRKMRAWNDPSARFFIVRDQDSGNCKKIKQHLKDLCPPGQDAETVIRIACREMESWFLGNLQAVDQALGTIKLARLQNKVKYRDPDRLQKPSQELKRLVPSYQKRSGARAIGAHLGLDGNRSKSFNIFIQALQSCFAE